MLPCSRREIRNFGSWKKAGQVRGALSLSVALCLQFISPCLKIPRCQFISQLGSCTFRADHLLNKISFCFSLQIPSCPWRSSLVFPWQQFLLCCILRTTSTCCRYSLMGKGEKYPYSGFSCHAGPQEPLLWLLPTGAEPLAEALPWRARVRIDTRSREWDANKSLCSLFLGRVPG